MADISQTNNMVFCGGCGALEYVRAVDQRAFAAGRQNDQKWTIEFAASSLSGAALTWYEELPEEYQTDWSLLRQALLNQFPSQTSEPKPNNGDNRRSLQVLTSSPRAASLDTPLLADQTYCTGRIRINSPNYRGYISRMPHPEGLARCQLTSHPADALRVRYLAVDGPHNIEIQDSASGYQTFLGATWYLDKKPQFGDSASSHADLRLVSLGATRGWDGFKKWVIYGSGSTKTSIWKISNSGKISAIWFSEDGAAHQLAVVGYYKTDGGEVLLASNLGAFLRANPGHEEARLSFEPL